VNKSSTGKKLRLTLRRSAIGYSERQKSTIRTLGLRKLGQVVERTDSPVLRGMINKVSHLVQVEEVEE
jgi:large subunit ribosomal protein L30